MKLAIAFVIGIVAGYLLTVVRVPEPVMSDEALQAAVQDYASRCSDVGGIASVSFENRLVCEVFPPSTRVDP
jgi:hypothetical protein